MLSRPCLGVLELLVQTALSPLPGPTWAGSLAHLYEGVGRLYRWRLYSWTTGAAEGPVYGMC